ncbi:MAG: HAD-IB family phosphatase [Planctomycetes bacterium]|nr:HAD-IB family phosphatase [Planctomycetota bacterium]
MRDTPPPYRTVVFDCDSTLSAIEGIDELGAARRAEIEALTNRAMSGELRLEDVYALRLALVRPSKARVERLGQEYVERALPEARALVNALHALEKRVVIVSGGVATAVRVLAAHLGVVDERVHAVELRFDAAGEYAGFDARSPLARSGGKVEVLRELGGERDARPLALVGDGITDLEAGEADGGADRFIAYGGVARRTAVFERARVTCATKSLAGLVPLLFSAAEIDTLSRRPEHAALLRATHLTS